MYTPLITVCNMSQKRINKMLLLGTSHVCINPHKPILRRDGLTYQWSFLVPLIGGRWYIIPQLAIYKRYISGIYCQLGDYMVPTTYEGNQKQLLNLVDFWKLWKLWNKFQWSFTATHDPHFFGRLKTAVVKCSGYMGGWTCQQLDVQADRSLTWGIETFICPDMCRMFLFPIEFSCITRVLSYQISEGKSTWINCIFSFWTAEFPNLLGLST